jgi:CheY-like chemotaxis protein
LVLIVEATAQYIERLTQQLYELGYRVLVARSGTEALEKARLMQPRMIFLNPVIPLLSGWDVLTLLKADPNTQNIPVLVTATQAEKQQARQHGADGFLALPIAKTALQKSLTQLQQDSVQRSQLTILCLPAGETAAVTPLQSLLQSVGESLRDQTGTALSYRILEADDIEQAALLARVWQPDVLILDGQPEYDPEATIDAIATTPTLATLPLITLDAIATQRAHPYTNLTVYPCLMSADQMSAEILLQVIQVAAGMQRQPHILVMDVGQPLSGATVAVSPLPPPATDITIATPGAIASPLSFPTFPPSSREFLQALSQYLCTAGFRVTIVQDGQILPQQIAQHQCDLLLLYWSDRPLQKAWLSPIEQSCTQVSQKLPTILLRHCAPHRAIDKGSEEQLEQLCDHTVEYTSTFAMEELLTVIKKNLD